ncbi:glycosyltransferase [bacterium 0.1xD8-71]|nr:glycosyltransferase [bacterium 0.1xD8-71]
MKKYNICVIPAYPLENVQLLKDRVLVPYACYRHFGESLTIVTQAVEEYPYLTYLEGAQLHSLPCSESLSHMEAAIAYVSDHYKEIDLLCLFGARLEYTQLALQYKALRPEGILYLKLDINSGWANALPLDHEPYAAFLDSCDIISCEARRLQQLLCQKWRKIIEYIPNGIYYPFYPTIENTTYGDKENLILTVGRIGSVQKNSHVLLYAYALAYLHFTTPWDLVMIGSVTPEFQEIYDVFCREFPAIAPHVHLTGSITDKTQLHTYYRRAKIFALTSQMEGGSPNVYAEAAGFGCTILTTDIDCAQDMTDQERLGRIVKDPDDIHAYAQALSALCADQVYLEHNFTAVRDYIRHYFDYDHIARRLGLLIEYTATEKETL